MVAGMSDDRSKASVIPVDIDREVRRIMFGRDDIRLSNGPDPVPPPLPLPENPPPRPARRWPWYALQISIFLALLVLNIEYHWAPNDNPLAGTVICIGVAFIATVLVARFLDLVLWLRSILWRRSARP